MERIRRGSKKIWENFTNAFSTSVSNLQNRFGVKSRRGANHGRILGRKSTRSSKG